MAEVLSLTFHSQRVTWATSILLIVAAGLAVAATAGQSIGAVLTGQTSGEAGITAEQAVLLRGGSTVVTHGDEDAVIVENDDGTAFSAAIEMHVGDTSPVINLDITNRSEANAAEVLQLGVPNALDVEVEAAGSGIQEAQRGKSSWLLDVAPGNTDDLQIQISPKDDAKPGHYTINAQILQLAG